MNSYLLYLLACFIIGSLPIGELFARFKYANTIIEPGTNTTKKPSESYEIFGTKVWFFVHFLDSLKGFLAVGPLAYYFISNNPYSIWWLVSLGGLLTVIGHCKSPFLRMGGGRGLAPTFGVVVTLLPYPALISTLVGFFLAFWGLSSKPGALSAAALMPYLTIAWVLFYKPEDLNYLYIVAFMSLWTGWEHKSELLNYLGLLPQKKPDAIETSSENSVESAEPPDKDDLSTDK